MPQRHPSNKRRYGWTHWISVPVPFVAKHLGETYTKCMPTILETYERKHPRSRQLFQSALQVFPGGVTHDTRHATPFPIFVERASGPRKWDVDGNEIIDYVSGHGALLLGHSHPSVVSAVREQIEQGTH